MSYSITVDIEISPDQMEKWYRGEAKDVMTVATDGRKVRFPASILQPYVTRAGIAGRFEIWFSHAGKFEQVIKIT